MQVKKEVQPMKMETDFGVFFGVTQFDTYDSGQVKSLSVEEENEIKTQYGTFVPKYTEPFGVDERLLKNRNGIAFHENGVIKSISLEKQSPVTTLYGDFPAELLTFYNSGKLHRIFPLNGLITGYWSEEDEKQLAEVFQFKLSVGNFEAKVISLRFYPSGKLRSLTLWPGEMIQIMTPIGALEVRTGFSLYEDGRLQSVEPASELTIESMLGKITVFDPDALGIHADQNSLKFNQNGSIKGFKSTTHGVIIKDENGNQIKVGPRIVPSYVDINEKVIMPITVRIDDESVVIDNGILHRFEKKKSRFKTYESTIELVAGCSGCSACNACK